MVSRVVGTIAVGMLVVAGLAGYASAFSHPIPTKISSLKWGGNPRVGRLYKIVSRAPEVPLFRIAGHGGYGPVALGGGLTVRVDGGVAGTLTCDLEAGAWDGNRGWKELGTPHRPKGFKYVNKGAPANDPCEIAIIKEKVIKILTKSVGEIQLPGPPETNLDVTMSLTVGNNRYCALASPPHYREKADTLIKMRDQDAPVSCCLGDCVDNGDGTISDNWTGLMWERKDDDGRIHDVDNRYSWAGCCDGVCDHPDGTRLCQPNAAAAATCSVQTGGAVGCAECSSGTCDVDPAGEGAITTIWDWLVQINGEEGSGFAGHSDWRIPEATRDGEAGDLESIFLEPCPSGSPTPCIDPLFGPTAASYYWTATTLTHGEPWMVGVIDFGGTWDGVSKPGSARVRAVRGGSPSAAFLDTTTAALD